MQQTFTIKEITENLQIARMRYQLPDTSAYIRYQPELSCDNTNISVQSGMMLPHESCEPAGIFKLAELVKELKLLLPSESVLEAGAARGSVRHRKTNPGQHLGTPFLPIPDPDSTWTLAHSSGHHKTNIPYKCPLLRLD